MAHEIDMSNGRANTAYVGQTPWHGLGTRVDEGTSIEEWRKLGGLDWEAELFPVQYTRGGVQFSWDSKRVLLRSDTGRELAVVTDRYKPVQPGDVLEFFRDLVEKDGVFKIHTVGSLRGGRKVWALAKADDHVILPGGDSVGRYLLITGAVMPLRDIAPGAGMESARGTVWGALNAVTYFVDHKAPKANSSNRMDSAWFGSGALVKARALAQAAELVGAQL